jgi:hypothetical protein
MRQYYKFPDGKHILYIDKKGNWHKAPIYFIIKLKIQDIRYKRRLIEK